MLNRSHIHGRLAANVAHFARALRRAGLPISVGQIADAQAALLLTGLESRDTVRAALSAVLLKRHEHEAIFAQAFELYWQNPRMAEKMMLQLLPTLYGRTAPQEKKKPDLFARVAQSMQAQKEKKPIAEFQAEEQEIQLDAALTFSSRDLLREKDFESLTLQELEQVKRELSRLKLPLSPRKTRRLRPDPHGHAIDRRATLRQMLRSGHITLARATPTTRTPPLVVLADISGSMDRYARLLLLFLHKISNDDRRVESFVFGTRLTRITRELRHRDVDVALARAAKAAPDWAGGTRLTSCLRQFNQHWGRRVLGEGAVVLLISDGLDAEIHEDGARDALAKEAERLGQNASKLLWLNPLLRYEAFEARPLGVRAVLPHVDAFLPVHNLASLDALAAAIAALDNPHTQRAWRDNLAARLQQAGPAVAATPF